MKPLASYTCIIPPEQYSYDHTESLYNPSLGFLYDQLRQARRTQADPDVADLALALIEKAKQYDIQQAYHVAASPDFIGGVARNIADPATYTHPSVIGQDWADDPERPLEQAEQWNAGRRTTNTHVAYDTDPDGLPVNPYLHFGIKGRGVVGRFGPNHAVDIGLLRVMDNADGKPALHALGIIRQDNGLPALCGGFTTFSPDKQNGYRYGSSEITFSQTHEFFEELVSGSIPLLPAYADGLDDEIEQAIARRTSLQGKAPSERQARAIADQLTTQRKLRQVETEDPHFLDQVHTLFEQATPCYAGPVLTSARNTDSAWMETYLSWTVMDDATWNNLKQQGKFDYDFKAGDDAQSVLWHEINPQLMETAMGSHDVFFAYLLGSYLMTERHTDPDVLDAVKQQARDIIGFLDKATPTPGPVPCTI